MKKCTECYNTRSASLQQGSLRRVWAQGWVIASDDFPPLTVHILHSRTPLLRAIVTGLCISGIWLGQSAFGGVEFERLLASLTQRWGVAVTTRFNAWQSLVSNNKATSDADRLKRANDFFNRNITFGDDAAVWNQEDYWATPLESLGKGSGDCEDFVIAKYFTLKEMGVESAKLRLIYVRAKTGSTDSTALQAHMVLVYYARPEAEPLVLDNLIADIRPASRRPDLVPVFSFNSEGIFTGVSGKDATPAAGTGRLSRWEDLLKRARAEGFE